MKIAFVVTGLQSGGAEMMLYKVLSQADRANECEVINLRGQGPVQELLRSLGVTVHNLNVSSPAGAAYGLYRLRNLLQRIHPAVIQSWMYHANMGAAVVSRLCGGLRAPLVWGVAYTLADLSSEKALTRRIIRFSSKFSQIPTTILYDSEASRRDHESIGYRRESGRVIPNGIDFDVWRADTEARRQLRRELGVPDNGFLIGLVGRLHPVKDHQTFFAAAEQLIETRSDVHFLLAGAGTEPSHGPMQVLLKGRTFRGRLHLLGHRSDVARVMSALDLLSCASRSESFPNVVLEALACGTLSTVSEVGDAPRLVPDKRFVVPPAAPAALASAWDRIASLPQSERKRIAVEWRRNALEQYSIARIAGTYQALYEELARGC